MKYFILVLSVCAGVLIGFVASTKFGAVAGCFWGLGMFSISIPFCYGALGFAEMASYTAKKMREDEEKPS